MVNRIEYVDTRQSRTTPLVVVGASGGVALGVLALGVVSQALTILSLVVLGLLVGGTVWFGLQPQQL